MNKVAQQQCHTHKMKSTGDEKGENDTGIDHKKAARYIPDGFFYIYSFIL